MVISDWHLPGCSGEELCRRIREEQSARQPFFVILVALDDGERVRRALQGGADDFMPKPFDRDDLGMLLDAAAAMSVEGDAS